jgi:C4-dicarboxylate-specific signal transduction histidine kinase
MIDCRAVQVSQVIINLLSNSMDAIDHLSEKWIKLSIRALDDNTVLIKVRDSGHGIPNDVVEKMMNPFFTTKAVGKGTGLGLSISLGIIDEHKGKLYYQLVDNHTEFVIELPMKAQPLVPVKESA